MQDPKNEKDPRGAGFEKALDPVHGIIERIRALEHPDWNRKDEDISSIKITLARYASELEHLKYRYEARGAELEKMKAQYTELERKFLMRPDAMRRAGEMEVTELVKKKHDLAALESSLEKVRVELEEEKERLAAAAKELVSARQAELEHEYAGKNALLDSREEKAALREKSLSEAEKHLAERIEEARRSSGEELASSFEHERAAFRKEISVLAGESEKRRLKSEELLARLAEAGKASEELESSVQSFKEAAAEARQKCKLAEMEKAALLKRLDEWDAKGPEFDKWRAELSAREENCRRIEENARVEAQPLRDRIAVLEDGLREEKHGGEKWRLKAEASFSQLAAAKKRSEDLESEAESLNEAVSEARQKCKLAEMEKAALLKRLDEWEAKSPEFEKWRAELSAREESCRRIEENAGKEAQPLRDRLAALEDGLRHEKHESERRRLKAEEALSQLAGARKTANDLESEAESLKEAVAEARQKRSLAEMEKEAGQKRLEEWDKKGPQLEKWRSELSAREENCKRIEVNAGKEAQPLRDRIEALEILARENEKLAAQAKSRYALEVPELEAKLDAESARTASLREELKGAKEHLDKVLGERAALEAELMAAKEKHLKAESLKDSERSKKMESLLAELKDKEREMEDSWTRRHKALEAEQKGYHAEFEKRQLALLEDLRANADGVEKLYVQKETKLVELNKRLIDEFQDRESRARAVEEELRVQAASLAASAAELSRDYELKMSELEAIKRKVLAEIPGGQPRNGK